MFTPKDEYDVYDEIDIFIDGDLETVYVETIEVEQVGDDDFKARYIDPAGQEISSDVVTRDDIKNADWMN